MIFSNNRSWGTRSNTLVRSKKTNIMALFSSTLGVRRSKKAKWCEAQDPCLRKPCQNSPINSLVVIRSISWSLTILSMSLPGMDVWFICVERDNGGDSSLTGSTSVDREVVNRLNKRSAILGFRNRTRVVGTVWDRSARRFVDDESLLYLLCIK